MRSLRVLRTRRPAAADRRRRPSPCTRPGRPRGPRRSSAALDRGGSDRRARLRPVTAPRPAPGEGTRPPRPPPAPPSRKATTESATVSVHSPVHAAANDSCARRRLGLAAVTANERAASRRRRRHRVAGLRPLSMPDGWLWHPAPRSSAAPGSSPSGATVVDSAARWVGALPPAVRCADRDADPAPLSRAGHRTTSVNNPAWR